MFKKIGLLFRNAGFIFLLALFGSFGGQGLKWMRRILFPASVIIYTLFFVQSYWIITIYTISFWLSLGYGIPEERGFSIVAGENYKIVEEPDKGSALGRFFEKLFPNSEDLENRFTRGTIGLLISLSMISIPLLMGTWLSFCIGLFLIIEVWQEFSWRNFGEITITLFKKEYQLLRVDLITYGVTTLGLLIIIHGFFG